MFKLGETVEVQQDSDQRWYPAMILEVSADGYKALWLYSDKAFFVAADKVRPLSPWSAGAEVQGMREDNRWYDAKVTAVNDDGTYDLAYTDGVTASHLATERIHSERLVKRKRRREGGDAKATSTSQKAGDNACREGSLYTRCDPNHCFNLKSDDHNCGACGRQCPKTARTCVSGECKCLSGSYDSDGNCL